MKKRWKWWLVPLAIIAVLLIIFWVMWPGLKVYLAPKTVLTAALTDTYAALERRFANSPLILIGGTVDLESGNTIDLKLDTVSDQMGSVQYDMQIQAEWSPRRILAQGQAAVQEKTVDLSVYLDGDFAALSSSGILQGNYYGLTYDTFPEDIRSNKLLSFVIGDNMLGEWESQIQKLQTFMETSWEMPSISEEDLHSILVGILTLKAEVDRESRIQNGREEAYYVISFETTGAEIQSGLNYLNAELPVALDAKDEVDISFWLQENSVVKIEVEAEDIQLDLDLGTAAESGDMLLRYENAGEMWSVTVSTQQDASLYQETITVSGAEPARVSYAWDLLSHDLSLQIGREGEGDTISANLSKTENGFRVETGDFEALMHVLLGTEDSADSPCVMTVSKGTSFATPEYKNFSDWSLDDLATLLAGVGSLFGLQIG